jgi:serine phosphatase RsbU (regulator of sigma subunit)
MQSIFDNKIYSKNVFFIILLFSLTILFSCNHHAKKQVIEAKDGKLDLSNYSFETNGTVLLKGEWEFYWKQYLQGLDFEQAKPSALVTVPSSWGNYEIEKGTKLGREGYATYRLLVKIPPQFKRNELLGIKTQFIATNHALFIQNKLANRPQNLGTSAETTDGYHNPAVYYFTPQRDTVEIVLHVANYAGRIGGITQSIAFGKAEQIRRGYEATMMISFFLFGVLIVMGCYHVSLYIFRQKVLATLWFALFCFIIALRILVTDDYYLTDLFPSSPFELGNKLSYLTFYVGVPLLAVFVHSLYPKDFSKWVVRVYLGLGGVFSLVVLVSKGAFYSQFLLYFQLSTLLIIAYAIYFVVLILLRCREGSIIFALGIITIFAAAVNDILVANFLVQTVNLMPAGLFVFVFSQTLILSRKFSNAFVKVEELSTELQRNNEQLELTVKQRTTELNEANESLSQNLEELRANIELINEQNKAIKAQNQSITSSINYAKNIQNNILPSIKTIQEQLPDSFLIFKPKDIVSGDFYYFNQRGNKLILAAVDCTGHGVPGAFMSLIGYEMLNELVDFHHIIEPAHILKGLHIGIKKLLKQDDSASRDGMDIALVVIDKDKREMKFAGAKNPLVYIENGKMEMIAGDNLHIGGYASSSEIKFTQTTILLPQNEGEFIFYLFSDGYHDQFGGEENKKLMKRHFKELLFQIQNMPMQAQGSLLSEWHEDWKGSLSQTDDILVMGVRI